MTSWRGYDLLSILTRCGQRDNLKLCLDAGDAASYTSGQSWLDRSGNGYDFFLGADGSATATDPTFTGTAGLLSSGEYFAHDGGDYFIYDSANETWMQNIHKDSATFTILALAHLPGGANSGICGTANGLAQVGTRFIVGAGNTALLSIFNGSGSAAALTAGSTLTINTGAWNLVAVSVDEAAAAGVLALNGAAESFVATYTSPSAAAATRTMEIGAVGLAGLPLPNASRLGMVAAWEGRALSAGEIAAIFMAVRGRFGV